MLKINSAQVLMKFMLKCEIFIRRKYLRKKIAISFEENNVKIVHAFLKGEHIYIDNAEIITEAELDYYLEKEKTKEFIVTYNFKDSFSGILKIPVVKPKYRERIIESEIRKTTELRDFSFIYSPLGEKVIENKKVIEVFYFAVENKDIRDIAERFHNTGKIVKAIYPTVFSVASLFNSPITTFRGSPRDETIIGVSGTGRERICFLTKNGVIHFIRNFQSFEKTLSDLDIQDINMTINYCFQNLRLNPSLVLLTGALSESHDINSTPSVPFACLYKNNYIHCSREILICPEGASTSFNEFLIPISSFYATASSNILSKEFKNIYILRKGLLTAFRVFVVLTLLCLGFISYSLKDTIDIKKKLNAVRKNSAGIENIFSGYAAKEAEIKKYQQLVDFLNMSRPDIQKLLITLSELNTKDLIFNSIEAKAKEDNSFSVTLSGVSYAETYTSMQSSFKDLTDTLNKIEGLEVITKTMDLQDKTFKIEMAYKE